MDFTGMSDQEVFVLRDEVNAEADRRLDALTLRNQTRDLALRAKDLGRTQEQVVQIVGSVLAEVFPGMALDTA